MERIPAVFLEINGSGQYAWLETATRAPITEAPVTSS
jgi:hypothetical protein